MNLLPLFTDVAPHPARIDGVLVGVVTSNEDPDGLGRLRVRLPLLGDDVVTDWTPVASFWAGKDHGAFFLPEVSDEVLVAFGNGDVNRPYVIGALYNGVDRPIVPRAQQRDVREIRTKRGQTIRLDERKNGERIEIRDAKQNSVVVDTSRNTITITAQKDLVLSAKKGRIVLDARQVEVKAAAAAKVQAGTTVTLQARKVDAKATQVSLGS